MWQETSASAQDLEAAIEKARSTGDVEFAAPFSDAVITLLLAIAAASPNVPDVLVDATRLAFKQGPTDFQ